MSDIFNLAKGLVSLAKCEKLWKEDIYFLIDCAYQHEEIADSFRRLFNGETPCGCPLLEVSGTHTGQLLAASQ